jgi:acetyl-CoA synthetase
VAGTLSDRLQELQEVESFPPPPEFVERANLTDPEVYARAAADPEAWWVEQAERLEWFERWDTVLDDSAAPFYKWFTGGKLNVAHNCVDRHVTAGNGDRVAFHWHGEEGETEQVTYADLHRDVQRFANALKDQGVRKGDVVGIFLPMVPEVVVAMLACARIGAVHNVVFGGFSPQSVRERMEVSRAKALITVDGARRKGKTAPIKSAVDAVMGDLEHIERIFVVRRTGVDAPMTEGRDVFYDEVLAAARPSARPSRWTPRTRCSSSTRRARRPSRRGSCTRRAAT